MNIEDLDFRQLLAFEAMMETQSVSQAAARVGMTQPAMSVCLGRMRKMFNDPLFVRTVNGMEPTPYAVEIGKPIAAALRLVREALTREKAFDPATSTRNFNIIMTDVGERVFLPTLLGRLKAIAPHVSINTMQAPFQEMQRALGSGEADLAIGFIPLLKAGFYQQRLFNQSYVCMVRAGHAEIRGGISLAQFEAASHVVVKCDGTGHEVIDRVLAENGVRRHVALHLTHFLAVPPVIANTDLVVTIPEALGSVVSKYGEVQVLPSPVAFPTFEIKQYWHERYHHDPGNKWLRELMSQLFGHLVWGRDKVD